MALQDLRELDERRHDELLKCFAAAWAWWESCGCETDVKQSPLPPRPERGLTLKRLLALDRFRLSVASSSPLAGCAACAHRFPRTMPLRRSRRQASRVLAFR